MKKTTTGHVLLVDDEPALIEVMEPVLLAAGHRVTVVTNGEGAIGAAGRGNIDMVLLDLGLPDIDGKNVINNIRKTSQVPILVVSARDQEAERIAALDAGADDYVSKPFDVGELLARIRAGLRRASARDPSPTKFVSRELEMDFDSRAVRCYGRDVKLSPKEFDLLRMLALNAGKVVTRTRLLNTGWASQPDAQYLRTYIGLLRQKVEQDPSTPALIVSEPGVGYRLMVTDA